MAKTNPGISELPHPLAAIREKERVLAEAIHLAKEQAQARIAEARARATALNEQAERDGMQAAEKFYQDGIATAREQAHAIRLEGKAAATQLRKRGAAHITTAVEYITQFVLPRIKKN